MSVHCHDSNCNSSDITWFACNALSIGIRIGGEQVSTLDWLSSSEFHKNCFKVELPSTVLAMKIRNKEYNFDDPYFGMNLFSVPDINITGPEEYTYWFVTRISLAPIYPCDHEQSNTHIVFRGINYSPEFYLDGYRIYDIEDSISIHRDSQSSGKYWGVHETKIF